MKNILMTNKIFVVILLLIFSGVPTMTVFAQADEVSAARLMIDKNELAPALTKLDAVIKNEPNNAAAYAERARILFYQKKNEQAAADADKALGLDPKNAVALNLRGLFKKGRNDYEGAIADFTAAVNSDSTLVKAYYNRADTYAIQKKYDAALTDLDRAVKLLPQNANAYVLRAQIYEKLGKTDLAIVDYTSGIKIKPKDLILLGSRGNLYLNSYKFDLAIADYRQALEVEPQNAGIKENLTMALARQKYLKPGAKIDDAASVKAMTAAIDVYSQKDYQAAVKFYTECINALIIADGCYKGRADAYRKLEKYDLALADYDIAVELSPTSAQNYTNRGLNYFHQKNYEAAIKDYNRAIELDPKNSVNYQNRGASLANLGKDAEGEADVKKALAMNPNDPSIKVTLDQIEANLHPPEQKIINGGASTEPLSSAKEYFERATGKFTKDKDYEGAILDFTACLNLEPNNYSCYYSRGASYYSAGKLGESLADINKSLELAPTDAPALDLKPKIIRAIAAQAENAGVEKEFDAYYNEYNRLADLTNKTSETSLHPLYKRYTGVDLPNNLSDLRPLNSSQKTELCKIVTALNGYKQTMEQFKSKMKVLADGGKLDQLPELKKKEQSIEELAVMNFGSDQYDEDLKEHLGCGSPQ